MLPRLLYGTRFLAGGGGAGRGILGVVVSSTASGYSVGTRLPPLSALAFTGSQGEGCDMRLGFALQLFASTELLQAIYRLSQEKELGGSDASWERK